MKMLISLKDFNAKKSEAIKDFDAKPNGIACPVCKRELMDNNPAMILPTDPPKKHIHCGCGYTGYRNA